MNWAITIAALLAGFLLYRLWKRRKVPRHRDAAVIDEAVTRHRTIAIYRPRGESVERVTEFHFTDRRD